MANVVELVFTQSFSTTNTIVLNHGQNTDSLGLQVVIGSKVRADLISSVTPDTTDPTNSFTITLTGTYSGLVQVFNLHLNATNVPNSATKAALENSGIGGTDTIPTMSSLADGLAPFAASTGTGIVSGANLSLTGGIGFSISAGSALVKDGGVLYFPEWTNPVSGNTLFAGDNYISIDKDGAVSVTSSFPNTNLAKVGYIRTDPTNSIVLGFSNTQNVIESFQTMVHNFARLGIGTLAESGCIVAEKADPDFLELNITSGKFFIQLNEFDVGDTSTFTKFYKTTDNDWVVDTNNLNHVNTTQWNDRTQPEASALVTMTDSYWKKDVLVRTSTGSVYYSFGQAEYATETEALKGALPTLPNALTKGGVVYLAYIVCQKNDTSISNRLYDIRPILSRIFGYGMAGSVGSTLVHANLLGLGSDDHAQYHTDGRADTWLGTKTTSHLTEGVNLYYTEGRVSANADVAANTTHRGTVVGNPHDVTKSDVGLGNVTDDAQLKRGAADFTTFVEKADPIDTDILLVEDSADANNKKKIQIGNLRVGGPALGMKADHVVAASFAGNPKKASVVFATAYTNADYSISLTCVTSFHVQFSPAVENKTAAGFTINMGANNINGLVEVLWIAAPYGEA